MWSLVMLMSQLAVALPSNAESVNQAELGQVVGTVSFKHRNGIKPMTMMAASYWSVVVHSDGADYELSNVFGVNREGEPTSVKIRGTVIRPGELIAVEGRIQKVRKDFGLLSEIGKINVVHDFQDEHSDLND